MNVDDALDAVYDCPGTVDIVVKLGGMHVDLTGATYDSYRDRLVLEPDPDDLTDALRKLFRVQRAARSGGLGGGT